MLALSALSRPFDYSGKAPRRELWACLLAVIVMVGLIALAEVWGVGGVRTQPRLAFLVLGLMLPALIAVQVRRLHDCGHGGLWLLLLAVPVAAPALWLYLLLAPGRKGYRQRDPAPLAILLTMALIMLAAALVLSRALWQPVAIAAGSMKPTLLIGDMVAVSRVPFYQPQRGDMIAFRDAGSGLDDIKRVIGLPGDRVQLRSGVVYINDAAADQTPNGHFAETFAPQGPDGALPRCANAPVGQGGTCQNARLTERLTDSPPHDILNTDVTPQDDTTVFAIPPAHYFLLGDNRDASFDSRLSPAVGGTGLVAADHVIGRARLVLFSSAGRSIWSFWTWRPDRFLMAPT